jgi:hypothetical protein
MNLYHHPIAGIRALQKKFFHVIAGAKSLFYFNARFQPAVEAV